MKQVLQNVKSGNLELEDVPPPALKPGGVIVRTAASLISAGTEKSLIELAEKSLVGKARARPDLVRQVVNKARKEGLLNTWKNVQSKLEKPMPLGYSAAGIVERVGEGVTEFQPGDRVAIAGAGYACHAEVNFVPKNLVARIPDGVSFSDAAYSTVASIALQGVRLTKPQLGEYVAVVGLGLIGLITVQLLHANGCRVIGIDIDPTKVRLGASLGMEQGVDSSSEDVESAIQRFTGGRGVDHTVITAGTSSNGPIELAGVITRPKGQVVAVGAIGMDIPRDVYYKKELSVKISMSYGPGRYDPSYEEGGIDYPYDYVRWTEQRNMQAVLGLLSDGRLDVSTLTTNTFSIDRALDAYDMIRRGDEEFVGVVIEYDTEREQAPTIRVAAPRASQSKLILGVGFVGAGNYAALQLLPHLKENRHVHLVGLVTATGMNARQKAEKFGFDRCMTDFDALLEDENVDAVFIATRHRTHAEFTRKALEAGKHVFVEKPMVVSREDLEDVRAAYTKANEQRPTALMVGLNRRFAPMVVKLKESLSGTGPKQIIYRVNSGRIPTDSWLHEPEEGGGMLVGEMIHFIDLMQFLTDAEPTRVTANSMVLGRDDLADFDNVAITVTFSDGSLGTLAYSTVGDKAASKERIEVYGGGTAAHLDDFRTMIVSKDGRRTKSRSWNQDKGQEKELKETVDCFREQGSAPIPFDELYRGMSAVFDARDALTQFQAE